MENLARLRNLIVSLITVLGLVQFESIGQPSVIDSLLLENKITAFSKNRSGDIFLAFEGGAIQNIMKVWIHLSLSAPIKLVILRGLKQGMDSKSLLSIVSFRNLPLWIDF